MPPRDGLLFGRVNIDDNDLQAIGVMVEESTFAVKALATAVGSIGLAASKFATTADKAVEKARYPRVSFLWGLFRIE